MELSRCRLPQRSRAPAVECLFGNTELAQDVTDGHAQFSLLQHGNDQFHRIMFSLHDALPASRKSRRKIHIAFCLIFPKQISTIGVDTGGDTYMGSKMSDILSGGMIGPRLLTSKIISSPLFFTVDLNLNILNAVLNCVAGNVG
jgi:hypothetical protein